MPAVASFLMSSLNGPFPGNNEHPEARAPKIKTVAGKTIRLSIPERPSDQ
jgi:hypothetical protein